MTRMGISNGCLRGPIAFGAGMEAAHPADLVRADPLRRLGHAFRAEIRAIGKHAGQHGGYVQRRISCPEMGELVGKSGPLMYFPQEIWHLDQRIHVRDFGIYGFRRGGNIAGMRRHDQPAVFHPDAIELAETQALQASRLRLTSIISRTSASKAAQSV